MVPGFSIVPALTVEDFTAVGMLFERYAAALPIDLGYQDFAAELAGLPGKYAPPGGALLLARGGDKEPLGCVGLRPSSRGCCEMKRLYILPAARELGLGLALTVAVTEEARQLGYRKLQLDTLSTMTTAQALYKQLGFERIAAYYDPTPSGTVFMSLGL